MRAIGERVVVVCPHDSNLNRTAKLTKVFQPPVPEYCLHSNIWEIEFDDGKEPVTASYNEFWLHKLD